MTSAENYQEVLEAIAETAYSCGRNPEDIQLVAVTKGHGWETIRSVYQSGCRNFGESWIQEALPKIENAPEDIEWHFIGHLQKNKARKAYSNFALIHSVDSFELALKLSEIGSEEGEAAKVLLEVNTSGEGSKHGFSIESIKMNLDKMMALPHLDVQGLMTMAPDTEDEGVVRTCFSRLWQLRDEIVMLSEGAVKLPHLSMGMSNDYRWAIQEGATILRIGSAIFGERR